MLRVNAKAISIAYRERLHLLPSGSSLAVLAILCASGVHRATIVNSERRPVGAASSLDLVRYLLSRSMDLLSVVLSAKCDDVAVEPVVMKATVSVEEVVETAIENRYVHVILVDEENRVAGVVTEETITRRIRVEDLARLRCQEVMSSPLFYASPTEPLIDVAKLMAEKDVRRIPLILKDIVYSVASSSGIAEYVASPKTVSEACFSIGTVASILSRPCLSVFEESAAPLVSEDDPLSKAAEFIVEGPGYAIVGGEGDYRGIITERDLVVKLAELLGVEGYLKLLV